MIFPSTVERFIGELKWNITATKDPMTQAGRNFILRHHTSAFMDTTDFCEEALACLRESGFRLEYQSSFNIHHATYNKDELMDGPVQDVVTTFIRSKLNLDEDIPRKRVKRLVRHNMTLSTTSGPMKEKSEERHVRQGRRGQIWRDLRNGGTSK
jgi:hypothetical protein